MNSIVKNLQDYLLHLNKELNNSNNLIDFQVKLIEEEKFQISKLLIKIKEVEQSLKQLEI